MKGHTEDVCRQHLLCNRCDRRGHLAEDCYATLNNMVLTRNDRLPRWPVKVNGVILHAILDSGAEHSVMSQATVERLGIQVNKSNEAIETSTGEICSVDVTQELELMFEHIPAYLTLNVTNLKAADLLLGYDWFDPSRTLKPNQVQSELSQFEIDNEEDIDISLNMLTLENDDISSEYFDDYACFDNNELDISELAPSSKISPEIEKEFMDTLKEKSNIFATTIEQLGCCKGVKF